MKSWKKGMQGEKGERSRVCKRNKFWFINKSTDGGGRKERDKGNVRESPSRSQLEKQTTGVAPKGETREKGVQTREILGNREM